MAVARNDGRRSRRRRERLAVIAMSLFPLLIGVGFLAPGWVRVLATAQETDDAPRGPLEDQIGPFSRRPLPAPREFFGASSPELLDLDLLFAGDTTPIAPDAAERPGSFPRDHGDAIVLDDLGSATRDIAFKDALMDDPQQLARSDDDDEGVLPICGSAPFGNCVRDDDFTGAKLGLSDATPVPEPATGGLLALGLGWLARRRARARYCQPITS
jgi:hypothetical protein